MGCFPSAPTKVSALDGNKIIIRSDGTAKSTARDINNPIYYHKESFNQITMDVHSLKCPPGMVPIMCLGTSSFPIATSILNLEDSQPTEIRLPIVAASESDKGKIFCMSQINFLSDAFFFSEDTSRLMYNVFIWLVGQNQITSPILLVNALDLYSESIKNCFETQGVSVVVGNVDSDFSKYQIIIITSDLVLDTIQLQKKFSDYISGGGGVLCFYSPPIDPLVSEAPINSFLKQYGLSYSLCVLNRHNPQRLSVDIPSLFDQVYNCHFVNLADQFVQTTEQAEIDVGQLDDLVTTLRYHILVSSPEQNHIINSIYKHAWMFLERTNYHGDDGLICPLMEHGILAVLIQDLPENLPVEYVTEAPEAKYFPGVLGPNAVVSTHELEVRLHDETWISTGLWLPAGQIGEIISHTGTMSGITVQIGAHTEGLLAKQGPWLRWPSVCMNFDLSHEVTRVASPFGGIVYITVSELDDDDEHRARLTFKGFCKFPRAVIGKPMVWEQTRNNDVPWAEISSKTMIFTMPTAEVEKIEDIDSTLTRLDGYVVDVINFMAYLLHRPYRIVFDKQLVGGMSDCGYPIVMLIDDIDGIFHVGDAPTLQLFDLLSCIAIISLHENCFDSMTEEALSKVVASIILHMYFPEFDPMTFEGITTPPLFRELWRVHTEVDDTVIQKVITKSQSPEARELDSPTDMWIQFVYDICSESGCNLVSLFDQIRPLPLSFAAPPYWSVREFK